MVVQFVARVSVLRVRCVVVLIIYVCAVLFIDCSTLYYTHSATLSIMCFELFLYLYVYVPVSPCTVSHCENNDTTWVRHGC